MGVAERMEELGRRVIRSEMPDQHRTFYQQLPFMLYGAVDADGNAWASILEGAPGFAHSPEPALLQFGSLPGHDDPAQLQEGAAIGLLGIEPAHPTSQPSQWPSWRCDNERLRGDGAAIFR